LCRRDPDEHAAECLVGQQARPGLGGTAWQDDPGFDTGRQVLLGVTHQVFDERRRELAAGLQATQQVQRHRRELFHLGHLRDEHRGAARGGRGLLL
jgi:hypothetical protein